MKLSQFLNACSRPSSTCLALKKKKKKVHETNTWQYTTNEQRGLWAVKCRRMTYRTEWHCTHCYECMAQCRTGYNIKWNNNFKRLDRRRTWKTASLSSPQVTLGPPAPSSVRRKSLLLLGKTRTFQRFAILTGGSWLTYCWSFTIHSSSSTTKSRAADSEDTLARMTWHKKERRISTKVETSLNKASEMSPYIVFTWKLHAQVSPLLCVIVAISGPLLSNSGKTHHRVA